MILKLALRNLTRNRWRTVLTIGGVAAGVAVLIWVTGYMGGFQKDMIRGATAAELGQISLATEAYVERPKANNAFELSTSLLDTIRSTDGVVAASPRVKVFGLVGNEKHSVVTRIVGVDPVAEPAVTVVKDGLIDGQWLNNDGVEDEGPRPVVLGYKMAQQLGVKPGDELVLFFEASDGSLGNELLQLQGIVRTNATSIDRQTAFMRLEDLQYTAALDHRAHEIAIKVTDVRMASEIARHISERIQNSNILVRSWDAVMPEIAQLLEVMKSTDYMMYFFVYLIVAFGLFNAQRMSALERRREFAMMMAIGVVPGQLFWVVIAETVLIVAFGSLAGALLGTAVTQYYVTHGLDLMAFSQNKDISFQYMGISFSNRLYFAMDAGTVIRPVMILLPVALLCGLWPAAQAVRTEITTALSGRN